jgi:methyl-accepting chemotaxis protein
VRIASKLILLITMSVAVIAFQFGVNRYMNYRMQAYTKSLLQLNRVNDNLLTAITEENSFVNTHKKSSLDNTLMNVSKAQEEMTSLRNNSLVGSTEIAVLNNLLMKYRNAINLLGKAINDRDGFENQFNEAVSMFNDRAAQMIQKMSEEIGTKVVNTEDVPEHLRSLMDITRQVTFLMSQMYLTLNQDLLLKNDMEAYIDKSGKIFNELVKEKKNAAAISAFSRNEEYSSFVTDALVRTVEKLPEWSAGIREAWTETSRVAGQIEDLRGQLTKTKVHVISVCKEEMSKFESLSFFVNLMTLCFSIIAVCGLGTLILRSIARPIKWITASAGQIASGDLHSASASLALFNGGSDAGDAAGKVEKDEIRHLSSVFVRMTKSLHSLIGQVRNAGIQVVSSATEISASARELEATASEQAASISEVNATSKEISAGSKDLAKTMNDVATVASQTASLAEEGHIELKGMESTMRQLVDATSSIAGKLETISDKTNNIGSIVTTITKVADQTNLLSLNAAIEAEKAGEYGLGFSVVAREIRRLADQSAVATLDIEEMVKEMQSAVSSGVMEVDKFVQQVRQGVQDVETISEQLATIIREVQTLIPHFEAVARAMGSQSLGAEEISKAMGNLSDGAYQTRQVVEEFNRAVEQLTEAVEGLQDEVSHFKVEA